MVNVSFRKKKSDAVRLLEPRKSGLFGTKRNARSEDNDDPLGKKGTRIFFRTPSQKADDSKNAYQTPTPPASPVSSDSDDERQPTGKIDDHSTLSDITDPNTSSGSLNMDPPGRHSSSNEDAGSPVGHMKTKMKQQECVADTSGSSLVQNLFCMVDSACTTPDPPSPDRNLDDVKRALSYKPEWGLAPTPTMDEEDVDSVYSPSKWDDKEEADPPKTGKRSMIPAQPKPSDVAPNCRLDRTPAALATRPFEEKAKPAAAMAIVSLGSASGSLPSERSVKTEHENFEMILEEHEREQDSSSKWSKLPSWPFKMHLKRSKTGGKKNVNTEPKKDAKNNAKKDALKISPNLPKSKKVLTAPFKERRSTTPKKVSPPMPLHRPKTTRHTYETLVEEEKKEEPDEKPSSPPKVQLKKVGKEARYMNLLAASFKKSKSLLETVQEEGPESPLETVQEEGPEYTSDNEAVLKVRVPGLRNPDAFISDRDLISEECQVHDTTQSSVDVTTETPATSSFSPETKTSSTTMPEIENIPEEPDASIIRKSATWIEKLPKLISPCEEPSENKSETVPMNRQQSAPEKLVTKKFEPPKSLWKSAVDEKTGRTYYYHRVTRKTTWTRPPEDELSPPKIKIEEEESEIIKEVKDDLAPEGANQKNETTQEPGAIQKKTVHEKAQVESLRKAKARDFDPSVWKTKQEIAEILKTMSPPDGKSVERLMAQYDGREEELLLHLRDLSESKPFDEPLQKGSPSEKKATSEEKGPPDQNGAEKEEKKNIQEKKGAAEKTVSPKKIISKKDEAVEKKPVVLKKPTAMESSRNSLRNRVRSGLSNMAGSSKQMSSNMSSRMSLKSRVQSGVSGSMLSESTQQIRNTASFNARLRENESYATSISSRQGDMLPPASKTELATPIPPRRIPSNIPVPRSRALMVEELTTERYKAETYDMKYDMKGGMKGVVRADHKPPQAKPQRTEAKSAFDLSAYFGDNDADTHSNNTDTLSYPTDSISALSETDHSCMDRRDAFDDARRRALDEAIAREDWDLAAALSEGMRSPKANNARGKGSKQREWTQTELDRFISENDWDAVADYIARVRNNNNNNNNNDSQKGQGNSKSRAGKSGPQKRFGARSQLQHKEFISDSSEESQSYSSFDSSYSSESSLDEDYASSPRWSRRRTSSRPSRRRQKKNFAC